MSSYVTLNYVEKNMSRYTPMRGIVTVSNEFLLEALIGIGVITYCLASLKENKEKKELLNEDTRTPYKKACDRLEDLLHELKNSNPTLAKIVEVDLGLLGRGNVKIYAHMTNVIDFGKNLLRATSKPMSVLYDVNEMNDETDEDLDDKFSEAEAKLYTAIKPFGNKPINGFIIDLSKTSFESEYDIINLKKQFRGLSGTDLGKILVKASQALSLIPKLDDELRFCNYSQSMTMFGYQYAEMLLDMANQAIDFVEASILK